MQQDIPKLSKKACAQGWHGRGKTRAVKWNGEREKSSSQTKQAHHAIERVQRSRQVHDVPFPNAWREGQARYKTRAVGHALPQIHHQAEVFERLGTVRFRL